MNRRHLKCPFFRKREDMSKTKLEHLIYFQNLLRELTPKPMKIDDFIQLSRSEILEKQYQYDKRNGVIKNLNEFREKYFQVDERTFRRWRNNEVGTIRSDSLPDFRKLSLLEEMYNEYHLNRFYKQAKNQSLNNYLNICYRLKKHSLFLPILETILFEMEQYQKLPTIDYWNKLKSVTNWVIDMEIYDLEKGDPSIPNHCYYFDRKISLLKIKKSLIKDKQSINFTLVNNRFPKKTRTRSINYYQRELDNDEEQG